MSNLYCAVDADGEIQKGSIGFYTRSDLEQLYPDHTIMEMGTDRIPSGAGDGKYKAEAGAFKKKTASQIKQIDDALALASLPPLHDEFMSLDVSAESDAVKMIYNFIKAQHGGL